MGGLCSLDRGSVGPRQRQWLGSFLIDCIYIKKRVSFNTWHHTTN
jgi:hypothetical protein